MDTSRSSSQKDKYPFTVFVEGNVGSGKTSFLKFFKKFDEFLVLEEPIEKWKDLKGVNLLDLKFSEPERFQFPFQHYATLTRLQQHLQATEKPIKMIERSLLTARRCFVKNANNNGSLHNSGFYVLEEWYEFVNEFHPIRCDLIIYLKTTPEIAHNRVLERAREEESKVDLDYLRQLHECHEDLLTNSRLEIPIIFVDANKNFEEIKEEYQRCFTEIKAQQNRESAKPWRDAILKI